MIDLGAWASETYRIPAEETPESEADPPPDQPRNVDRGDKR